MEEFEAEFASLDCRDLTGFDMLRDHDAFLDDDTWRTTCMRQIDFSVARLATLVEPPAWEAELERQAAE